MNLLSPVPYFVLFGLFCLAAGWLSRAVNLRNAAQGKGSEYSAPIDGLRGLLAMSVFFHHATVTYFYLRTGVWVPPASNFYAQMGPFAVTMFFFVTGFLFWSKLKKSPGPWSLVAFVKNRGRRLMPAYLFSVVLSIAILLLQFGPGLRVAWPMFIGQVLSWVACGVPFGFPKINGLPAARVVNATMNAQSQTDPH